jgi:hypothetical protein
MHDQVTPKYDAPDEINLRPGEPFFLLRAQDALAPFALENYAALVRAAASGVGFGNPLDVYEEAAVERLRRHSDEVHAIAARMLAWQAENRVKLPD